MEPKVMNMIIHFERRQLFLVLIYLSILACCCPIIAAAIPTIELTSIPAYNSTDDLTGRIANVNPQDYHAAVFIFINGWWTKPFWDRSLTSIQPDGGWTCDITTGGIDETATRIAAFLVPKGVTPPRMSGQSAFPPEFLNAVVAQYEVIRPAVFRVITFSGYEWLVKSGKMPLGPGPNYFSDSPDNVWVDHEGALHLKCMRKDDRWYCAEVVCLRSLGYGAYTFALKSEPSLPDRNAVLGLFTWDDAPAFHHREIDIEFSQWGQVNTPNAQYVVQPWDTPANITRFALATPCGPTRHTVVWQRDRIAFSSVTAPPPRGANNERPIMQWTYAGADIPEPGDEHPRINLWLFQGKAPSDEREIEVVLTSFSFAAENLHE
jgi:hypothetical protein